MDFTHRFSKNSNNSIRICGDFKVAVNSQTNIEQYLLPTRESLFHTILDGKYFSKIYIKDGYLQMELDETSKQIMGPYDIASAPYIFQKYIGQILGIDDYANYLDDIIISAPILQEHFQCLKNVLLLLNMYSVNRRSVNFCKTKLHT